MINEAINPKNVTVPPGDWKTHLRYTRDVDCPRPCGYRATEVYTAGSKDASVVCLKCGLVVRTPKPENVG